MTSCGGGGGDDEGDDDDEGDADGEDVPRRIEPGGGEWITVKSRIEWLQHPNTVQQEGLQPAKASFGDNT